MAFEQMSADAAFLRFAVDFLRADLYRCHHGKQESILLRDLGRSATRRWGILLPSMFERW